MISFISIEFLFFVASTYFLYFLIPMKLRWLVLLGASLYFYCSAGLTVVLFPLVTAGIAYVTTRSIAGIYSKDKTDKKKAKPRLILGIASILVLLLYCRIGSETAAAVLSILKLKEIELRVIVPLGLSYYTFSVIGYMADVYWQREMAETNYLKLLLYMIYFPHILQGPIPRHKKLAPQLIEGHSFQYKDLCYGLQRMGWGYFKKLVIANRFAQITREVFGNYTSYEGIIFIIAIICAAIELYCDFSGGMDIVLGISEALSIRLDENFQRPFFAKSTAEFWRRWHITLGKWFKDYVFMPLAASSRLIKICQGAKEKFGMHFAKQLMSIIPLAVVWILTGLWHGTGLNYVVWGVYWGTLIILSTIFTPKIKRWTSRMNINTGIWWYRTFQVLRTFLLFLISRLLTAPGNLEASFEIARKMFAVWNPEILFDGTLYKIGLDKLDLYVGVAAVLILWSVEILQERKIKIRDKVASAPVPLRWGIYYAGILIILVLGIYGKSGDTFIYMNY